MKFVLIEDPTPEDGYVFSQIVEHDSGEYALFDGGLKPCIAVDIPPKLVGKVDRCEKHYPTCLPGKRVWFFALEVAA